MRNGTRGAGVARLLLSGWIPAVLVAVATSWALQRVTHVSWHDLLAYAAWFLWAHLLPGTVLWRVADWRTRSGRGRPFLEDAVLGSVLGIVLALPVYLAVTALGHPRWILLWPVLALACGLAHPRARRRVLRRQPGPTPAWFSWSVAALVLFLVGTQVHHGWSGLAITPQTLRAPYIDEPYHLALVNEFKHHVPAEFPFVAGTPLRYHWMVYPFLAMGVWGSGAEAIALLRVIGPVLLSVLVVLGLVAATSRLAGRRWAGIAAAAIVTVLSPLDVFGWTPDGSTWMGLSWLPYPSPTQLFANALAPLLVVLVVGVLRGAATRPWHWALTALVMLAVAGAKSAMLPLFVAGLCLAAILELVLRRRFRWRSFALAALSVVVFVVATELFYGSGSSRSLTLSPFQATDGQALRLGLLATPDAHASTVVTATLVVVFVVCFATPFAGAAGFFPEGGWRRAAAWFPLGLLGASIGAVLVLRHPSLAQYYFLSSSIVPMGVLAGVGWARAVGTPTRARALLTGAVVALGLGAAYVVAAVTSGVPVRDSGATDAARMVSSFVVPLGLAAALLVVVVVAAAVLGRRVPVLRGSAIALGIALLFGMCLPRGVHEVAGVAGERAPVGNPGATQIWPGGIPAAQWLRDHSSPDDVVATNAHTRLPRGARDDHRHFWISAWTERRVLVEGWAYIPPDLVGLPSTEETNRSGGPRTFWAPERLRLNDEVFTDPTRENLQELREKYHVRWLFADLVRGVDTAGLDRLADRREQFGGFVVYRLRG